MTEWKDERKKAAVRKRPVPQMPEGYYSGDKPNPRLKEFVEAHLAERPYDPETDRYDVPAFDHAIETTKATAIYNMHTYWSKKPHDAIREYIRHYTKPGDLMLDPFCGSGGTALAALMEGRKAIAIDRSPAATFITKNYCTPVDVDELRAAFEVLKARVMPEIDWLYETRCDRCGGKATTAYTVYSQVFQCPRCMEKVALFDCPEAEGRTKAGKPKKVRVCPHCQKRGITEEIGDSSLHLAAIPVLTSYLCESGCKPSRDERQHDNTDPVKKENFERNDLGKLEEIDSKQIPYWIPTARMMNAEEGVERWGMLWRPYLHGRVKVADFFRPRNLWALGRILAGINDLSVQQIIKDVLLFAFSSNLLNASDMYRYRESGKGGISMGTYYVGPIFQVMNAWRGFEDKVNGIRDAYSTLSLRATSINISCQSATDLRFIPDNSIDYIFTDPPYSWKVQFGESNFIWEAWLGFNTQWHNEEIIVNEFRDFTDAYWANKMREAMKECYRVLKPGRWISLCYHDTSDGTWELVQDIMAETEFLVDKADTVLFIDTDQKSWKQQVADKVNKRDLVINFHKPKLGEVNGSIIITELDDFASINTKVSNIIRSYLSIYPGSTKDRIFDELVSRMVRRGQMETHHFEDLLSQVAEPVHPEGGANGAARWYLRETEIDDYAESGKEDAAASAIREFIAGNKKPEDEGVHYSDIFEHYVYVIPAKDKPRRPLVEWLLDYFYKTDEGTYRLPASPEEEQIKKEGRSQGVSRRIKRYLAYLEQGVPVPAGERPGDATIADWIRHCKRSGMYEQGKLLYEKGGLNLESLTEEEQVNVDEDYQICGKMLARAGGAEKRTKRSRKAGTAEEI